MTLLTTIDGSGGIPPEPDWKLTFAEPADASRAHEEWALVVNELKAASALTVANGHAIKRLVIFRILYDRAADTVIEQGAVVPAKRTKVPSHSAYWTVLKQSSEAITTAEAELGLSPTRRDKLVAVKRNQRQARAADEFLGKSG